MCRSNAGRFLGLYHCVKSGPRRRLVVCAICLWICRQHFFVWFCYLWGGFGFGLAMNDEHSARTNRCGRPNASTGWVVLMVLLVVRCVVVCDSVYNACMHRREEERIDRRSPSTCLSRGTAVRGCKQSRAIDKVRMNRLHLCQIRSTPKCIDIGDCKMVLEHGFRSLEVFLVSVLKEKRHKYFNQSRALKTSIYIVHTKYILWPYRAISHERRYAMWKIINRQIIIAINVLKKVPPQKNKSHARHSQRRNVLLRSFKLFG